MDGSHFPPPTTDTATVTPVTLRDYQEISVQAIRDAFGEFRRVLFVLPTGGGKTICFAFIAREAARKGKRVMILAHRKRIVLQIAKALTSIGVDHGLILSGKPTSDHPVQVAMIQTLARRIVKIEEPALLVIDEAHHGVAGTWEKVSSAWTRARILGVTATPERLDGRGLRSAFDEMVLGPKPRELIEAGALSEYTYLAPPNTLDLSGIHIRAGDYSLDELAAAMMSEAGGLITGDAVEHYAKHLNGKPAIAFCINVAHAKFTAAAFRAQGWRAASVDGTMPDAEVADLIEALGDGRLNVLTSCDLISEGVDVPNVGGCILLRPTKSLGLWLQQIGRALRPNPDGSKSIILDHVGSVREFGMPCFPRDWNLDGRRKCRPAADVTTCKLCFKVMPVAVVRGPDFQCGGLDTEVCPYLEEKAKAASFIPEATDGELEAVENIVPSGLRGTRPAWAGGLILETARGKDWFRLLDLAGTDAGRLEEICTARGYKKGWVGHQIAKRHAIETEVQEFLYAGVGDGDVETLSTEALWPAIREMQRFSYPGADDAVRALRAEYLRRKQKAA